MAYFRIFLCRNAAIPTLHTKNFIIDSLFFSIDLSQNKNTRSQEEKRVRYTKQERKSTKEI